MFVELRTLALSLYSATKMASLKRTPPQPKTSAPSEPPKPPESSMHHITPVNSNNRWKRSAKHLKFDDDLLKCDDEQTSKMILVINDLHKLVSTCMSDVRMLLNENVVLKNNILELKKIIVDSLATPVDLSSAPNSRQSFSSVLKSIPITKAATQKSAVLPLAPAGALSFSSVLMTTQGGLVDSTKVKKPVIINPVVENDAAELRKVLNKLKPTDYSVASIRNTSKGGVVIECGSSADRKKLASKAEEFGSKFTVSIPEKKLPRVRLYGMSNEYAGSELVKLLKDQNGALFPKNCVLNVVHSFFVEAKSTYGAFIETDAESFANMMEAHKVFVGWDSCWINEDLNIRRCFKCWGFNHVVSTCKSTSFKCPKCCGEHHQKDCTSSIMKCPTCCDAVATRHLIIDTEHSALSACCPSYLAKAEAERRRIAYNK